MILLCHSNECKACRITKLHSNLLSLILSPKFVFMNIDTAKERFDSLCQELNVSNPPLETEQDARLHIIDRILIEVLGWDRQGIRTEPHTESGYIDYLLSAGGRNRLVVEAKRTSNLLIDTRQPRMAWYKVSGSALKSAVEGLEQAKGVFFSEYKRWKDGEHKPLYQRDKEAFKEKFGGLISDFIAKSPHEYVRKLLKDSIFSRKLMPCIVFDNTDHFPQSFQESVFQFAQSIYRECFSFIICPITDRTVWQLSKSGPLQSYDHRDFYLPVPSTKEVLTKRVEFIKEKAQENAETSKEYFTKKGIRLSIPNVKAFALSVEAIFIKEDYVGRMVGWLANFDIRRGLQIAQKIITSPIIDVSELVKAYAIGEEFRPQNANIKKALLLGDYNHFYQKDSSFILNLFDIGSNTATSPLLRLSVLRLLIDAYSETVEPEKIYRSVEDILNYFEPTMVSRTLVKENLKALLDYRLIEPYDPTDTNIYESQRVKITQCGHIHYEWVTDDKESVYMSEMALMTPVVSQEYILKSRQLLRESEKLNAQDLQRSINAQKIVRWFVEYCLEQDKLYISLPKSSSYQSQKKLREILFKNLGREVN